MRVLVTGANGQLGRDVVELFRPLHEVYGFRRAELDITDQQETQRRIHEIRPDVIIHTAAYTAVDQAEVDRDQAYLVNATGTRNVAAAAADVNATICAIGTDYVFDGEGKEPYTEVSQPNPMSVYGATKLAGEQLIKEQTDKYFIVRTSWVFGVHGSNFVKTMLKLGEQGEQLKVVNDQVGSPTYTKDLSRFLLELTATQSYGTYHASNSGSCSWYEFALEIFRQSGLSVDVSPCATDEFPRPAPRPKYSVLSQRASLQAGLSPLQPWKDALGEFLQELNQIGEGQRESY